MLAQPSAIDILDVEVLSEYFIKKGSVLSKNQFFVLYINDVIIQPNQKIGNIQKIDMTNQTTEDDEFTQEQKQYQLGTQ